MKIVAVYNIKGGVGKTTIAANLGYHAATRNFSTLLLDLDPQGSISYYFRVKPHKKFNSERFIKGTRIQKFIRGSDYNNLDVLPSDLTYRHLEILLAAKKRSRRQLRRILMPVKNEYDLIILDCPPNITLVAENIFKAADLILIPVIPTTLSMLGFQSLKKFFEDNDLNIKRLKPFFSMVEKRKKLHCDIVRKHTENKSDTFCNTHIPYNSAVEKMGLNREPVHCFAPKTSGARAFQKLWDEVESIL
ncbi:AAA family ATPase [Lentisphaerota bacterium ZTH]|nr:AAA family ATPase [Lentisphaerota bacterium]WET07338.1 AAA family ATPase [Lentisphaerota bacterium ZTH]